MIISLRMFSVAAVLATALFPIGNLSVRAQQQVTIQISVQNHQFSPREVRGSANVPIILIIRNQDSAPMEFESVSLRVEKVIAGNSQGVVRLRPLAGGRYEFFDDFHQETRGALIIQ